MNIKAPDKSAKKTTQIAKRVRNAVIRRLQTSGTRVNTRGYVETIEENLISGIASEDFYDDLAVGAGNELTTDGPKPPKFCAVYSSSALAVNAFGPFRRFPHRLTLDGETGFNQAKFEYKAPTGLRGTPPHFDFFARGDETVVAVESKFTEIFSKHKSGFKDAYREHAHRLMEPEWLKIYDDMVSGRLTYQYLDAAQLIKHYMGLMNNFGPLKTIVLAYVFWEPVNYNDYAEYREHRRETADFMNRSGVADTRFVACSYLELWKDWLNDVRWERIREHVEQLRFRYEVEI